MLLLNVLMIEQHLYEKFKQMLNGGKTNNAKKKNKISEEHNPKTKGSVTNFCVVIQIITVKKYVHVCPIDGARVFKEVYTKIAVIILVNIALK